MLQEHLGTLLAGNHPFYMDFYPESDDLTSFNLRKSALHPQEKIFLSSATLVVVPSILRLQWEAEILKHVKDGALRVLVLKTKDDVVSVENLANSYDVSLLSPPSNFDLTPVQIVLMTYDGEFERVDCSYTHRPVESSSLLVGCKMPLSVLLCSSYRILSSYTASHLLETTGGR